jgi:hypothetical protein
MEKTGDDMTAQNIDKFYQLAYKNPSLVEPLNHVGLDQEAYAKLAVELGAHSGCEFSVAEANAWLVDKAAALSRNELDDQQLEAVAGGKLPPGALPPGTPLPWLDGTSWKR